MGVDAIVNRTIVTEEHLKSVTAPVLIVHGHNDFACESDEPDS
jgi:Icc-related predicted phosphoesterase